MSASTVNKGLLVGIVLYLLLIPCNKYLIELLLKPIGAGDVRFVQSNVYLATAIGGVLVYFVAKLWCHLWAIDGSAALVEKVYETLLVPLLPALWAVSFMQEPLDPQGLSRATGVQWIVLVVVYLVLTDPGRLIRRIFAGAIDGSDLRWARKPGWSMTVVGPTGKPELAFGHILWNLGFFGAPLVLMFI